MDGSDSTAEGRFEDQEQPLDRIPGTNRVSLTGRRPARPRGVLLVAAFGLFQAVVLGLVGVVLLVVSSDSGELAEHGVTRFQALTVGALVSAIAVVALVASIGLFRGLARIRILFGVLATLQVTSSVYALVALRDVQIPSLVVLAISVGILWLLYGTDETREFFT